MASVPLNYRNRTSMITPFSGGGGSPQQQRRGPSPHNNMLGTGPSSAPQGSGGSSYLGGGRGGVGGLQRGRPSDLNLKLEDSRRQSSTASQLLPSPRNKREGSSMAAAGGTASRTTSMNHGGLSMFDSPSQYRADGRSQAESGVVTPTTSVRVNNTTPHSTPSSTRFPNGSSTSQLGLARRDKREVTKCGWLEKFSVGRGMLGFKNWQKRYFTVNSNGLNYSKTEKAQGSARTYIPFVLQKKPEVKLAPVFLLHTITPNLHPEAHDAGRKYFYFGIRFEENKKSFLLLLRTVDSSTRERWVRFLAQLLPWGVQYNLGVPPSHPQDPTLQRLFDPEDLDEKERSSLRKTMLDWDEGYQEFRYRKIVLKALAIAATSSPLLPTNQNPKSAAAGAGGGGGEDSSFNRLAVGGGGGDASSPLNSSSNSRFGSSRVSRVVSMGSSSAAPPSSSNKNNSNLSQSLLSPKAGGGAHYLNSSGRSSDLTAGGSGRTVAGAPAFHIGGDSADPDSPYFTGVSYIGGASSLSAIPAATSSSSVALPSAPNSSSYLARCFGFGGPQQGWEMQDGDKEDEDDEDIEEVDCTSYAQAGGGRLEIEDTSLSAPLDSNNLQQHQQLVGGSPSSSMRLPNHGGGGIGGDNPELITDHHHYTQNHLEADSFGDSSDHHLMHSAQAEDLPSAGTANLRTLSSQGRSSHQEAGIGRSAPITPLDPTHSNPMFPPHQGHYYRQLSSPSSRQSPASVAALRTTSSRKVAVPLHGGMEEAANDSSSTTIDYDENSRHQFMMGGGVLGPADLDSPEAQTRRTPTSASTGLHHHQHHNQRDLRARGMTAVVRPTMYGSPVSSQTQRSRADSSIRLDNSSSTPRNASFISRDPIRDPRRRPTLGPEL